MDKVKTGIRGFDKLVKGGIPKGKSILINGTPGTGKTIFALQYIYNGAKKYKQKGIFVTFEESSDNLRLQAKQFGWDIAKLEEAGQIKVLEIPAKSIKESTARDIIKFAKRDGYDRLVIDSLSALAINTPSMSGNISEITAIAIERFMYHFINGLKNAKTTTLLITQANHSGLSRDGVSEFLADGVVHIKYETLGGDFSRYLSIRKMRQVKNDEDIHPLEISSKGIVIHSLK